MPHLTASFKSLKRVFHIVVNNLLFEGKTLYVADITRDLGFKVESNLSVEQHTNHSVSKAMPCELELGL